jgi:hypothetical protein
LFRDTAKLVITPARVLLRHERQAGMAEQGISGRLVLTAADAVISDF